MARGRTSRARFLRLLPRVFKGSHVELEVVNVRRSRTVRVSASRSLTMYADGDPVADLPVTGRALAGAVRGCVPSPG